MWERFYSLQPFDDTVINPSSARKRYETYDDSLKRLWTRWYVIQNVHRNPLKSIDQSEAKILNIS